MARQITKYLDSRGGEYATEAEADRADTRHAVEELLEPLCSDAGIDLAHLESWNRVALQPLIDYLTQLAAESDERTRRYG